MKKKIALVLTAVVAVSALTGCSNKYEQVLVGEWATVVGASSADMVIESDGTYSEFSDERQHIVGTWSITDDGVLSTEYSYLTMTMLSESAVFNVEIIDNDTIKFIEDDYYTYYYRVGGTLPQKTYMSPALVTSANSTAAAIKNNIDVVLINCDTDGFGMKNDDNITSEINISVVDGTWNVTNSNTDAFKNGSLSWQGSGSGRAGDQKDNASSAEDLLAIYIADLFPSLKNASIKAFLQGGDCVAVIYVVDTSVMPSGVPDFEDFERGTFEWSGDIAGTISDDIAVGTAPWLE